ncbi:MAG: TonB family protein [Terriglobales bacterium]
MKTAPMESRPLLVVRRWWFTFVMLAFAIVAFPGTPLPAQQPETHRKAVQKEMPHYPEIAKAMKLSGTVRVAVKVAPNGRVVSAEVLGGHPLFAAVAVDAARQFRFETAPQQTEEVVTFNFHPE